MKTPRLYILLVSAFWLFGANCTGEQAGDPTDPVNQPLLTPESPLVALTPTEYNNAVRDLLVMPDSGAAWPMPPAVADVLSPPKGVKNGVFGVASVQTAPWPWEFPAEIGVDHFEGLAEGQVPSPYAIEEYQKAAMHFAAYVLVSPAFFACSGWEKLEVEAQKSCAWQSLLRFAQRAWRRPLSTPEKDRLESFWTQNLSQGTSEEAIVLTVAGILQSPGFVYRTELGRPSESVGQAIPLSDWEMASKLSFFFWDSIPDGLLFEAASRGELSTVEEVEAQARRMLEDPRARSMVVRFHEQWLETEKIHGVAPARSTYGPMYGISPEPPLDTTGDGDWPTIMLPIRNSMEAETQLFVEKTIFDGEGTLKALLTDHHGYMSQETELIYGPDSIILEGPTVNWDYGGVYFSQGSNQSLTLYPTEYPANQRPGILTQPSVLAVGSYTVHPAPIIRGTRILERVACQHLGAPPPGAEAAVPPDSDEAEGTNRERTEVATSADVCAGCHQIINPPGFAFENFDAMGHWRDEDNGKPVDASGNFTLSGGENLNFVDVSDFVHQLAESVQVQECYVLRWARYATGVQLEHDDEGLSVLSDGFGVDGHIQELLVSITTSDLFRYRRAEAAP